MTHLYNVIVEIERCWLHNHYMSADRCREEGI